MRVTTYDGRAYLAADKCKYDVIMVDAYQDITIPFQMSSAEFFTLVRDHLEQGGVMVVNLNMANGGDGSINAYLCDTISSVFTNVMTSDVRGTTNRVLFASEEPIGFTVPTETGDFAYEERMTSVMSSLEPHHDGGLRFTDDRAPVELLGIRMIDSLISDELAYYKNIFAEKGLGGLIGEITG